MDMRLMIPRRRSSFNAGNFGTVLGTDGGAAIVTEDNAAIEIGAPLLDLTYYTDGNQVGDDYMNNGGGTGIGIHSTASDVVPVLVSLLSSGSRIIISDGTTDYLLHVVSTNVLGSDYSIFVEEDVSSELFADATPVTLRKLSPANEFDAFSLTYRTGGVDAVGNMWSDLAHNIGVRDYRIVAMASTLADLSQLSVTDGVTSYTLDVSGVPTGGDPFFSIPVYNDLSFELFADGTPITITKIA